MLLNFTGMEGFAWQVAQTASRVDMMRVSEEKALHVISCELFKKLLLLLGKVANSSGRTLTTSIQGKG